jgi:hypothetical protein
MVMKPVLGTLTRFVEERYAPEGTAGGPPAHGSLPELVPYMLWILSRPKPVAQRRPIAR